MSDRRATIEAAFKQFEDETGSTGTELGAASTPAPTAAPVPSPTPAPTPNALTVPLKPPAPPAPAAPAASGAPTPAPTPAPASDDEHDNKTTAVDKPPQSWKPAQRAKWATLDPEVRQEIMRRERDVDRTLSQSAQARQLQAQLVQVVSPYMARVNELDMHPLQLIQEFFKVDHSLRSGTVTSRAKAMAKLINDYEIDVEALDNALSGSVNPKDSEADKLDKLLQDRLKPFLKFIEEQTSESEAQRRQEMATMERQIEAMAEDQEKFPEFANVYQDMADLIEVQAKRGVYLTLEQAYTRAVAMNPEASERVRAMNDKATKDKATREAHERAQKALAASKSVTGAPNGTPSGTINRQDRRATIAAAFDASVGR